MTTIYLPIRSYLTYYYNYELNSRGYFQTMIKYSELKIRFGPSGHCFRIAERHNSFSM